MLRTNARITPLVAVLRGRDLLPVEAPMHTRPIHLAGDAASRGHVFCCCLALILRPDPVPRSCAPDYAT